MPEFYFDPFGPFRERLADGSYYAIWFTDAFSTLLWLNTIPTLRDWFGCLERLVARMEAEKGSTRVVSELACDSAPMFKSNTRLQNYADRKGIVLLFSPPYTQKFNVVERSIRTVGEMSLATLTHPNLLCVMRLCLLPSYSTDCTARCLMAQWTYLSGGTRESRFLYTLIDFTPLVVQWKRSYPNTHKLGLDLKQ